MKKSKHYLPAFLILILTIVSCSNDDPKPDGIANFTLSKNIFMVEESITIVNQSQNAIAYIWDFGDGNISVEENPLHWYTIGGTFKITLTVTGESGNVNSISQRIEIIQPEPLASFEVDKTEVLKGEAITFTNISQNAISYYWNFGDGNTSIEESPTHTYTASGEYIVELNAIGINGSQHSYSKSIQVAALEAEASFELNKNVVKINETISITNTSKNATSYLWDFGDGHTSTEESPTYYYSETGDFTISLTVTGDEGEQSTSSSVRVYNIEPGIGLGTINLNVPFNNVTNANPNIDLQWIDTFELQDIIFHVIESTDLNVYILLRSSTNSTYNLSPDDIVTQIHMYDGYIGQTSEGIKIGSTLSEVEEAYGTPDEYDVEDSYYYYNSGIFLYYNTQNKIDYMVVTYPASNTNQLKPIQMNHKFLKKN